jgi:hypothetical protein
LSGTGRARILLRWRRRESNPRKVPAERPTIPGARLLAEHMPQPAHCLVATKVDPESEELLVCTEIG